MTPATSRRRQEPATPALAAAAILAAGLWAYHNSFFAPFIFDDIHVILDNPHILRVWPLTHAMDGPAGSSVVARPVVALSLAVNYALGGFAVWGYHAVSVALHLASALTLYGIVRRTLLSARLRRAYGTAAQPLALFTALLWLVHPLLTEAVTYIIQRTELFMGLFYLLTLYCAIRAGDARHDRGRWRAAAVACCLLGMASKEVMVTAPILVVLYDWTFSWPRPGRYPRSWC
jgi:hypothetical protein